MSTSIRCYDCGALVSDHELVRRTVRTGSSNFSGKSQDDAFGNPRSFSGSSATYGRVNLCLACNAARTRNNLIRFCFLLLFIAGGAALIVWGYHSGAIQLGDGRENPGEAKPEAAKKKPIEKPQLIEEPGQIEQPQPIAEPKKKPPSPEEVAQQKAAKEKALAKRREETAATKLVLANSQIADGKRNLGNRSGEKLIEFGIRRLEAVIEDYPETGAAVEAQQLLKETRQFLDDRRKGK